MNGKNQAKAHPLLYVITAVVAINLIATVWLAVNFLQRTDSTVVSDERLPEALGSSARSEIYDEFRSLFNAEKYAGVFEWLHDYAKVQMDKNTSVKSIENLGETFGSLGKEVYSHYLYKGREDGKDWFILFYKTKFSGGSVDFSAGTVEFDVFYDGENYGVTGFRLGAN